MFAASDEVGLLSILERFLPPLNRFIFELPFVFDGFEVVFSLSLLWSCDFGTSDGVLDLDSNSASSDSFVN